MVCTGSGGRSRSLPTDAVGPVSVLPAIGVVLLTALILVAQGRARAAENTHQHPKPVVLAPGYADLEFEPPPVGSYALPPLGSAADGAVLDIRGQERRLFEFLGDKPTVLSFIYTRCSDVNGCPLATFVLRRLQQRIDASDKLRDQVRLISLSFDPDYDKPEVLARYSTHFKTADADWQFLTCATEAQLAPVLEGYDQWVVKDYDEAGNYRGTMSHLLRVYLIDRDKMIRNIYSVSFLHADTVVNDLLTLLAEDASRNSGRVIAGRRSGHWSCGDARRSGDRRPPDTPTRRRRRAGRFPARSGAASRPDPARRLR